jgi:hypothetical protein
MKTHELTSAERELIQKLPGPPTIASIRSTNVWIIEWLPPDDQRTGLQLHEWMKDRRPGWSTYSMCKTKQEIISTIERVTSRVQQSGLIPVLHLEAHGGNHGLEGPNGTGGRELLTWDELTEPLQNLNLATRCNLVVFVAACAGFAGIKAFQRGPRAPAVALVGPDAQVMPRNLLDGTKEFYRRWMDESPRLLEIATSASQQSGTVNFEWEPFAVLAYEAIVERLIVSMRADERRKQINRIRQRMLEENRSAAEIEDKLALLPSSLPTMWQRLWDDMFMIDLYPENRERFGLDMSAIVELVLREG